MLTSGRPSFSSDRFARAEALKLRKEQKLAQEKQTEGLGRSARGAELRVVRSAEPFMPSDPSTERRQHSSGVNRIDASIASGQKIALQQTRQETVHKPVNCNDLETELVICMLP